MERSLCAVTIYFVSEHEFFLKKYIRGDAKVGLFLTTSTTRQVT